VFLLVALVLDWNVLVVDRVSIDLSVWFLGLSSSELFPSIVKVLPDPV
jgi:hypothetical protein